MTQEPHPHAEEILLIQRIAEGDYESFVTFYEKFGGIIYSTALRILTEPSDAEDVAQEVFQMIWEKAALYDSSRGKPLTWAITMTRNKAIDRLRSLQRRFRLRDEFERELRSQEPALEPAPADSLFAGEQGELLRRALSRLSAEQRDAIEMAFFGGMSQTEIAEKTGEPLGTVKARIRRGLLKLRRILRTHIKNPSP